MFQEMQIRLHTSLDHLLGSMVRFTLHSRSEAFSMLKSVAILRRGKRLGNRLHACAKERWQEYLLDRRLREFTLEQLPTIQDNAFRFVGKLQVKGEPAGRYCYSAHGTTPILYASVYSALLCDLLNKVDDLNPDERHEWIDYINSFQCEDGLYRDPLLKNDIAESIDWWGWRHLSAHVVSALAALGGQAPRPFDFLKCLYGAGRAYRWISELPWREGCANVSNTVMNYGVLLQYERDVRDDQEAGTALSEIFAFLDENINPGTGLWGCPQPSNPQELSEAVQTSYHLWNLYFYDRRTIPYVEKSIDSCLQTQNRFGGFGITYNSSACEDIDSIDPLCRFYFLTDYRHSEIELCLRRAVRWVSVNQMSDGGFVFRRFAEFEYGHELMKTEPEESNLFATWFRMLSLAYMGQVLNVPVRARTLKLKLRCPGYQFWDDCIGGRTETRIDLQDKLF